MTADDEGTPLWVKIVGAITLLLIGSFIGLALVGGDLGDHDPDRHAPSSGDGATDGMPTAGTLGPGPWSVCWVQPVEDAQPGPASGADLPGAAVCSA